MAFKKYLIYFERIKVAHKNLKRLQMGRNISTKDRSGQDLIEPHKSESKRTKMSPTSFPGSRFFRFEIERKRKSPR